MYAARMPPVRVPAKVTGLLDKIPPLLEKKTKKRHGDKDHIVIDGLSAGSSVKVYADGIIVPEDSAEYTFIQVYPHWSSTFIRISWRCFDVSYLKQKIASEAQIVAYGARAAVDKSRDVQAVLSHFIGEEGFPLNIDVQSHDSQFLLTGMLHPDSINSDYVAALRCMSPEFHANREQKRDSYRESFLGTDEYKAFVVTNNLVVIVKAGCKLPDWLFLDINDMSGVDGTPVSTIPLKELEARSVVRQLGLHMYNQPMLKMLLGRLKLVDSVAMSDNIFFSKPNRECDASILNRDMIRTVVAPQDDVGYTLSMYIPREYAVLNSDKVIIPCNARVGYLNGGVQ